MNAMLSYNSYVPPLSLRDTNVSVSSIIIVTLRFGKSNHLAAFVHYGGQRYILIAFLLRIDHTVKHLMPGKEDIMYTQWDV